MAKSNEIEVFEYLQAKASINGININDLQSLLLMPGPERKYKHLKLRIANVGYLLLFDQSTGKNIYLSCVSEYHKLGEEDCYRIRRKLGTYTDNQEDSDACIKCHLKCIDMLNNGQI